MQVSTSTVPKAPRLAGELTQSALREAAVRLIALHGYHGVSLRTLADEIGIQAASLYNHIESKQDLLFALLRGIMEELLEEVRGKVDKAHGTLYRLCTFVEAHVEFHTRRQQEVFIGTMELRSLLPGHREVLIDLRTQYEKILQGLVDEGIRARAFNVPDRRVATFAIFSMLNGVATWYRVEGALSVAELQRMHVEMTLNLLGCSPAVLELLMGRPLPLRDGALTAASTSNRRT
jgi:AcrR family transcriptional regulator